MKANFPLASVMRKSGDVVRLQRDVMRRPRAQCKQDGIFLTLFTCHIQHLSLHYSHKYLATKLYVDLVMVDYGLNVGTDARRLLLRYDHNTPPLDGSVSRVNNYQISSGPSLCHAPVVRAHERSISGH